MTKKEIKKIYKEMDDLEKALLLKYDKLQKVHNKFLEDYRNIPDRFIEIINKMSELLNAMKGVLKIAENQSK